MNDKEKRIKQERMTEATFNGLMGFSGKFGVIAKCLGQPIIEQNAGMHSEFFSRSSVPADFLDPIYDNTNDQIPTMQEYDTFGLPIKEPDGSEWTIKTNSRVNSNPSQIGWHFDGLSRKIHLEIKYISDISEITVYFKGNLVYKEVAGDLFAYVPSEELREKIDVLFKIAKKIDNENRKKENSERIEEAKKNKASWIEQLRKTWGI